MQKKGLKIALASDHAGYELKKKILDFLTNKSFVLKDFGTYSAESADYPDYVHPLAEAIKKGEFEFGIIMCGSGNGVNMTANKHQHIRSALCWIPEIASLARKHNDANVLALSARFLDDKTAFEIVDAFLEASFEGGRHQDRVDKIVCK
ncbi:MAG: ribose 5-phosphate isomerase B [Bacteroidetes bacterium]|nr:MAG: ribose 5-phosphate isomerase B [Bacteroidota bacterium]